MSQQDPNYSNGMGQNGNRKKSPEEIEAEITRTRSQITGELNELGQKLSPDKLRESARGVMHDAKQEAKHLVKEAKEAAVDSLREAKDSAVQSLRNVKDSAVESVAGTVNEIGEQARRAGSVTAQFVSENAVPLTLIGIGAAWLTLSLRRRRSERDWDSGYGGRYRSRAAADYEFDPYDDVDYDRPTSSTHLGEAGARVGGAASSNTGRVRERIGNVASSARERIGERTHQARERLGDVAERVGESTSHLRDQARERAAQLGHRASELSGEARVRLQRAQTGAREFANDNPLAVGAVAIAAGVGVGLMLPATRRENQLMGPTRARLVNEAKGLMSDARDSAERVADAAKDAAREVKTSVRDAT